MIVQRLLNKKEYLHDFSFYFTVDESGCLTGLFWADEVCKKNYLTFSDVISFDAIFNTNKYKMVFVPFTGIDNHFRNVNLGAGLIAKETIESYTWLLTCFLKAFGHQPKIVVTDQDPAIKQAIESVFTESRHRLCMWHIMKKIADKVGPAWCNNEHFKLRICNIVWTDSIEPDEFEMKWHEIVNEFGLIDNSWISTMFGLRSMWIPAYYHDEPLSGLMCTTSRSERENQFFGLVSNSQLTLVEFFSHFDMALETQRYAHRKMIMTREIRNPMDMDQMQQSMLKIKKLLEKVAFSCIVSVIVDDNDFSASCSCKRFEQYGLLLRHVFVAFRVLEIVGIPKKYILRRWMRDAVSVKSKCSIFGKDVANGNIDKANEIVRDIMFATENICNMFFTDIEELSKVRDQINGIRGKAEEGSQAKPILKKNDMLASLLGYDQPSTSTIRVPTGIRNKGRGSHKRIKSIKEIAASHIGKRSRTCSVCGEGGHDIRTCEKLPVYPPAP
ncbi:protein FAR1-RELATED SEQUENCE 5-like [Bidens hawaiensis]|uniref:protein FAR1-RELATED SEQUENCE 5-like n=1 Tax=Bidens hawaiensis TaxID=980011 RepID=UPI0040499333